MSGCGVVEDAAVIVQEQRVRHPAGLDACKTARLLQLELRRVLELVEAHERKVEEAGGAARREVLLARAHRERRSRKPPLAMHSVPARRRSATALATWARRTPTITPASSNAVTSAA